jgi:hypothetical protein
MLNLEDIETGMIRLTQSELVEIFDKFFILAQKMIFSKLFIGLFFLSKHDEDYREVCLVLLPKPMHKKKIYISLIIGSFFEGFSIPIPGIRTRTETHVIKRKLKLRYKIIQRVLAKLNV